MSDLTLRELELGDIGAVAQIEALASPDPWSAELFAGELSMSGAERRWLVATLEATIVGFAGMMYAPGQVDDTLEGHLMNVAVHPRHTRQGVARRLLVAAFAEALERHVDHLTLEVRVTNHGARALYTRFGFAPVGVRPKYYPDGEDALILWVHDIGSVEFRQRLERLGADRADRPEVAS